jgi:hypothetical protein
MEHTKNELSPYEKIFFDQLKNHIDKPIYFYGSIQRYDYFPQLSDIDIDIFTDNIDSTISKVNHFLNINKNSFKKSFYKMDKTNKVIPGYKYKYIDSLNSLTVEMSLYDEKYKQDILVEHISKFDLPFYISFILIILKFLHYNMGILPIYYYSLCKKYVTNNLYDGNKAEFFVFDF